MQSKRLTIKLKYTYIGSALFFLCLYSNLNAQTNTVNWIGIQWQDSVAGDFSFAEKWSYPEGVYINRHGQLSCDGFCPEGADMMKDSNGRIPEDSLPVFYQIVDTSHQFHTFKSKCRNAFEWGGSDYARFRKIKEGGYIGYSMCNAGTHSSINFKIKEDSCTSWVDLNSVTPRGSVQFPMRKGSLILDRKAFENGMFKGVFQFVFENPIKEDRPIYWEGQFLSPKPP